MTSRLSLLCLLTLSVLAARAESLREMEKEEDNEVEDDDDEECEGEGAEEKEKEEEKEEEEEDVSEPGGSAANEDFQLKDPKLYVPDPGVIDACKPSPVKGGAMKAG